jgi:catechol 2,3-dioxygenase-like lactoylglutathione lyase family enzyme
MADRSPFATSGIHHVALRVEDVEGPKNWLVTVLGFRVEREFQFAGNEVVLLSPGGT